VGDIDSGDTDALLEISEFQSHLFT
jgi:hypothetical protein